MIFWCAFIGFAALWWLAMVAGPQVDDLRIAEWHHAHLGVALALIAVAFNWPALAWLGVGVLADDAVQHAVQRWYFASWRSPLSRLYGLAYRRWLWLRRLNWWLDTKLQ